MNLYDFTTLELNRFRSLCNFTPDELTLFDLRAECIPLETCAERMHISLATAKRISRKVNSKILRVC